jgi:hypothetical protein
MRKLNSFEILANENANAMYSRLNILVEEVNGLGAHTNFTTGCCEEDSQCPSNRQIWTHCHSATSDGSFSCYSYTNIGKDKCYEMYMHINDKDESSSKRKDLALKAN